MGRCGGRVWWSYYSVWLASGFGRFRAQATPLTQSSVFERVPHGCAEGADSARELLIPRKQVTKLRSIRKQGGEETRVGTVLQTRLESTGGRGHTIKGWTQKYRFCLCSTLFKNTFKAAN